MRCLERQLKRSLYQTQLYLDIFFQLRTPTCTFFFNRASWILMFQTCQKNMELQKNQPQILHLDTFLSAFNILLKQNFHVGVTNQVRKHCCQNNLKASLFFSNQHKSNHSDLVPGTHLHYQGNDCSSTRNFIDSRKPGTQCISNSRFH